MLKANGDRSKLSKIYIPQVRFQIPSNHEGTEYVRWLEVIFRAFIISLSGNMTNFNSADRFYFDPPGEQGGIGGFYIGSEYFESCKLYVYNGRGRSISDDWKGAMLVDHHDLRSKVAPIYLLAEKLEAYLKSKRIPYQRFGTKVEDKGECEQITE